MGPVRDAGGSKFGPLSNALELVGWALPVLPSYVAIMDLHLLYFKGRARRRLCTEPLGYKYAVPRPRHAPLLLSSCGLKFPLKRGLSSLLRRSHPTTFLL